MDRMSLVQVAQTIKNSFQRTGNLVSRYGGEEFVVIMPELEKGDADKALYQAKAAGRNQVKYFNYAAVYQKRNLLTY